MQIAQSLDAHAHPSSDMQPHSDADSTVKRHQQSVIAVLNCDGGATLPKPCGLDGPAGVLQASAGRINFRRGTKRGRWRRMGAAGPGLLSDEGGRANGNVTNNRPAKRVVFSDRRQGSTMAMHIREDTEFLVWTFPSFRPTCHPYLRNDSDVHCTYHIILTTPKTYPGPSRLTQYRRWTVDKMSHDSDCHVRFR